MKPEATLKALRKKIDRADKDLLNALAKRSRIVQKIARAKLKLGLAVVQVARRAEIQKDRSKRGVQLGLSPKFVDKIFNLVQSESVQCQKKIISQLQLKKSRSRKGIKK